MSYFVTVSQRCGVAGTVRAAGTPSTQNLRLAYHYLRALVSLLSRAPIRRRERAMRAANRS